MGYFEPEIAENPPNPTPSAINFGTQNPKGGVRTQFERREAPQDSPKGKAKPKSIPPPSDLCEVEKKPSRPRAFASLRKSVSGRRDAPAPAGRDAYAPQRCRGGCANRLSKGPLAQEPLQKSPSCNSCESCSFLRFATVALPRPNIRLDPFLQSAPALVLRPCAKHSCFPVLQSAPALVFCQKSPSASLAPILLTRTPENSPERFVTKT